VRVKGWRDAVVTPDMTVRDTMRRIDASSAHIALVVDATGRLVGTVTDGDIRRALLRGASLEVKAVEVMNATPTRAHVSQERESILALMKTRGLHHIPIVDEAGNIVGLEVYDELLTTPKRDNIVVLMAGGLGSRMRPLTNGCPKPLLRLGDRPILEHIVESFVGHGFCRFYIAVNYLGEMIEAHFGDGSRWGADIRYIREPKPLGTAGALSLLPERPAQPVLVMNGDLLTKVNFNHLIEFHETHAVSATMCVRNYEYQIPYGVVAVDDHRLVAIEEKPHQRCFVSAGIYVLSPDAIDTLDPESYLDMPSLFENLIRAGRPTAAFPVGEYWLDIGRIEDFERANGEFDKEFR
jgi:dTDP-glucose pyrophosphorylase